MLTIYEELLAAGVPIANHYSDLYAKVTPESRVIIDKFKGQKVISTFKNQRDNGELWFDIAFAYDPYWEKVAESCTPFA